MLHPTFLKRMAVAVTTVLMVSATASAFAFPIQSIRAQDSGQAAQSSHNIYLPEIANTNQSLDADSSTSTMTEEPTDKKSSQSAQVLASAVPSWQFNGSDTFYGYGNVGIGVNAPSAPLDVRRTTDGMAAKIAKLNGRGDVRIISAENGSSGVGTFSQDDMGIYVKGNQAMHFDGQNIGVKAQTIILNQLGIGCYNTGAYGLVYKVGWDPGGQGSESTLVDVLPSFGSFSLTGTGSQGYQETSTPIKVCVRNAGSKNFVDSITIFYLPFMPQ